MYDPIFRKSFNRTQRKRFGCCAIFLCFVTAFGVSSTLKPHLHPISLFCDGGKMQISMNAGKTVLRINGGNVKPIDRNPAEYLQLPGEDRIILNASTTSMETSTYFDNGPNMKKMSIICRSSNYCEMEGDIRIEAKSSTIFVRSNSSSSWNIEPYPRKGTSLVKNWTIVKHEHIPKCSENHSHPAILFSVGGFSGNFFHAFADVLFPLYLTSSQFQQQVQFLATDHKPWWITKFRHILNKLTEHNILDIDTETSKVHCYNKIKIGLKFHKELIMHPSLSSSNSSLIRPPSMHNFRLLLRQAYSLERETTMRAIKGDGRRPRLMIISRQHTRVITNEHQVSRVARKKGFEVVVAESMNVSSFAESVNSCDVLVGVHGAGLTNMLFLPDKAVLIQLIPFGGIDGFARLDFGNPAAGMNISYLEYKIGVRESSLSHEYPMDHRILRDPQSYMKWDEVSSIYLNKQNVTVDLRRFKGVLANALNLLRH